jgi:hypothetical protein
MLKPFGYASMLLIARSIFLIISLISSRFLATSNLCYNVLGALRICVRSGLWSIISHICRLFMIKECIRLELFIKFCTTGMFNVTTLALGLWPRQGVARLWAKRETRESHNILPRVQRLWRNEPSHSQVNSHVASWSPKWTPESSERDYRGQKPIALKTVISLQSYCSVDVWNEFALPIWTFETQVMAKRKYFNEKYNFVLDLIAIWGLHAKLCASKVAGVLVVGISGLALESPGTKNHLDVAPMESCIIYYKGEGDGFPKVWVVVCLVSSNSPWFVLAPKMLHYALTTLCWFCVGSCEWMKLFASS